jgi:nitrate reductase alpha subunit
MGWLPSAPGAEDKSVRSCGRRLKPQDRMRKDYVAAALKSGELEMSCMDPDDPHNWPRNMFVWRSNLLGSSGQGA